MSQITAEMIERGRNADLRSTERRRLSYQVREVREKITSGGEGHGAFEMHLVRIYAENRVKGTIRNVFISLCVAALASLWAPMLYAIAWCLANLMVNAGGYVLARWFLSKQDPGLLPPWRARFVGMELVQGIVWAGAAYLLMRSAHPDANTGLLALLIIVGALNSLTAATIPYAVYAAVLPLGAVIIATKMMAGANPALIPTLALVLGAEVFFLALARRLYDQALGALYAQAEKDGLIAELEQAKANSDEARRRAEEANLAKSRFLATMSHELRTPLNAILGFSELMKDEMMGAHSVPLYREYSNDIHSSGQHLLALINEILDLSRVEAGRYELKEDAISVSAIIADCRHLLTLRAEKRDITIDEMIEPDLPRIWADERAIRQVALNLLTNAIKFTPQGGLVTIKVGWTSTGGQYFSVRDTGPGIPESEIPIVLSSFGRGSMAQKNADEGSGLGLPIVKGLVELHGGSFTLRSKVREGTEVIVILPPERVMTALPQLGAQRIG
jgi:two-component system cell cycle sensor histidine kinase PleC